jgi:hypothetical protein
VTESINTDHRAASSPAPHSHRRAKLILLIVVCGLGFFIADLATPICWREPFTAMLSLAVITAQLTVICVWGTLVRGTFLVRLPWTLLLLLISWSGFALGIQFESGSANIDEILSTAFLWLFGFVTSFVPLKIAALCFGWQIIQDSVVDQRKRKDSGYTIRDLMLGTLLLAASLGIGRMMLPYEEIDLIRVIQASFFLDRDAVLVLSIFGVISLLVKLPCIWISLAEKREKIPFKIGIWVFYCFALAILEIVIFNALFGAPGSDVAELYAGIILGHQVMGAIMLFVCLALRGLGYRMERSFRRQALQPNEDVIEVTPLVSDSATH